MQISASQMQQMAASQTVSEAARWRRLVDASLPPDRATEPEARFAALTDEVVNALRSLGPVAPLLAVDVRQTTAWLRSALAAGAPYRETRVAALLHGAAALGALWFVDDRLLAPEHKLPILETPERTMAGLLAHPQGARFRQAAEKERHLRPGLQFALRRTLAEGLSADSVRALVAAAFETEEADEAESDDSAPQRESEVPTPQREAAARFIAHERSLLAQAGVGDRDLQALCTTGDLVLGMGRCVRLLAARDPARDAPAHLAWLREAIDGLAGLAH